MNTLHPTIARCLAPWAPPQSSVHAEAEAWLQDQAYERTKTPAGQDERIYRAHVAEVNERNARGES